MKTLIELFEVGVEKYANNPLMWEKTNGKYQSLSYKQIKEEVRNFGAGLISIGIKKGDRIGLIAEGRTDWLVSELGMFYAGAINVPLSVKLDAGSEIAFIRSFCFHFPICKIRNIRTVQHAVQPCSADAVAVMSR